METLINDRFIKIIKETNQLFLFYLLLLALGYASYRMNPYQPIFIIILGFLIYWMIRKVLIFPHKYLFIAFFTLGLTLRILYVVLVPTVPFSDFEYYHINALSLSQNIPVVSKNFGFVSILSLGYRIYPDIITGKIINLIASFTSLLLVYELGKQLFNKSIGVVSLFLFSISINEINMISVIGTEIIAECLLLFSLLFVILSVKTKKINKKRIYLLFTGISFGFGFSVRSSVVFFALLLFIILMFFLKNKKTGYLLVLTGLFLSFTILTAYFSIINGDFSLKYLTTQDSFPILSGTNFDSDGRWSIQDANLYFSWPSENRDTQAKQEAFRRVVDDPIGFMNLVIRKYYRLLASNDYGNDWSLQKAEWKDNKFHNYLKLYGLQINSLLSQSIYIIIIFFAFIGSKSKKQFSLNIIFLFCSIFCLSIPHIILEVQPRYHHFLIPLLIPFAGSGICEVKNKFRKEN